MRAQAAAFVARAIGWTTGAPLPVGGDRFTDIGTSVHRTYIEDLAGLGIISGDGSGRFNPEQHLSRGQMASILTRTIELLVNADLLVYPDPPAEPPAGDPPTEASIRTVDMQNTTYPADSCNQDGWASSPPATGRRPSGNHATSPAPSAADRPGDDPLGHARARRPRPPRAALTADGCRSAG